MGKFKPPLSENPPCIFGCFCQIVWPIGLFYVKMSTNGSRVWITGLIIFFYRFFYSLLFKPATHRNTAKGAKLLHPLDVQNAKKALASGGLAPWPPTGGSAPGPPLRLRPQTPVIGSCARATALAMAHNPNLQHLPTPLRTKSNAVPLS